VETLYSAYCRRHRAANGCFQPFPLDNPVYSLTHSLARGVKLLEFHVPHDDNGQSPEGRQIAGPAMLQFGFDKAVKIPAEGKPYSRLIGQKRLNENRALLR
jgi:hypothetical protein